MKDHVATVQISRYWAVPGLLDKRAAAIDIGGSVLGGLASSRLDKILVREEKLAVAVSGGPDATAARGNFPGRSVGHARRRPEEGVEASRSDNGGISRQGPHR